MTRPLQGVLIGLLSVAATSVAAQLIPRPEVIKPAHTEVDPAVARTDVIKVKFRDGLAVRLRDGNLTDMGTGGLRGAEEVLTSLARGRWERAYSLPEAKLDELRQTAQTNLGEATADLNLQFKLWLPKGADAAATIDALNALDCVEMALPVPLPVPPPAVPNLEPNQGYLNSPPLGLGAKCMWLYAPDGTGSRIKIADLEYNWNRSHLDLPQTILIGGQPQLDDDHGTAVLGELAALRNGWGVTGMAYDSAIQVVATISVAGDWDVGGAVTTATGALTRGDVILIEQQAFGPNYPKDPCCTAKPPSCAPGFDCQFGLVPVEWVQDWYNAIKTAVGNGIVVVEAAGNGTQDLDDPRYSGRVCAPTGDHPRRKCGQDSDCGTSTPCSVVNGGHWPFLPGNDSGAIIVGAGAAPGGPAVDRSRVSSSNYGSRVDVQAWGEFRVYTTGYGDTYPPLVNGKPDQTKRNLWYTNTFAGTSSASAMVAAACAALESLYEGATEDQTGTAKVLTPDKVRSLLQETGFPQQPVPVKENIGPRPNVPAAISKAFPDIDLNGNWIPDNCECDVDGDGNVDRDDINLILAARNTPRPVPKGDFRDIDADGMITVNDARICALRCTKPLCAP